MQREYDFTGGDPHDGPIAHMIPMTPAMRARPHYRFPWRVPSPPRSRPGPYGVRSVRPWTPAAQAPRARNGATAAQTTMTAGPHGEGCLCDLATAAQRAAGRHLQDGATAAHTMRAAGRHSGADDESRLRNSGADDESGWAPHEWED